MQLTMFQFCSLKRHSSNPLGESYEYFWQIEENFYEEIVSKLCRKINYQREKEREAYSKNKIRMKCIFWVGRNMKGAKFVTNQELERLNFHSSLVGSLYFVVGLYVICGRSFCFVVGSRRREGRKLFKSFFFDRKRGFCFVDSVLHGS